MSIPEIPLDPADFVIVPNVFVVDEFDMTDEEGNVVARIDATFIRKIVARMQEREETTGDLCPFVIGHTKDNPQGSDEVNGPPLVGYFRNWKQLPFFDTGKTAAAPDAWIFKGDVERVKKFPRRSSEVWVTKYEIDPVSALGATTPARDLGLLKLARGGGSSFTYSIGVAGHIFERPSRLDRSQPTNRESDMAEPNKDKKTDAKTDKPDEGADKTPRTDKPKADEGQTGGMKEVLGKIDSLTSTVQSLADAIKGMTGGGSATPVAGADGAPSPAAGATGGADGGGDASLSDDELNKYLADLDNEGAGGGDATGAGGAGGGADDEEKNKSRKGEEVVKNNAGYPGGNDTNVPNADVMKRLQRQDEELQVMRVKLARTDVRDRLRDAVKKDNADINPEDETLVTELVSMPPDMRENMIVRLSRIKSKTGGGGHISDALKNGQDNNAKRRVTDADKPKVMKLARQKNVSYEEAAVELGFVIGE